MCVCVYTATSTKPAPLSSKGLSYMHIVYRGMVIHRLYTRFGGLVGCRRGFRGVCMCVHVCMCVCECVWCFFGWCCCFMYFCWVLFSLCCLSTHTLSRFCCCYLNGVLYTNARTHTHHTHAHTHVHTHKMLCCPRRCLYAQQKNRLYCV